MRPHRETHRTERVGWLRAAVLGANHGIVSTASTQLMRKDALGVHAREELGITEALRARPLQAALASAASFAAGATVPLLTGVLSPSNHLAVLVAGASLVLLALLGGLAARVGGARVWVGAARVALWSALAMGVTAAAGAIFGGSG